MLRQQFQYFLIATQFLTRLPIPARLQTVWGMEDLRDSVHMFPLVGVLVGLGASLVYAAAVFCDLPPVIAAILAVATQILMTGRCMRMVSPMSATVLGADARARKSSRSCATAASAPTAPSA